MTKRIYCYFCENCNHDFTKEIDPNLLGKQEIFCELCDRSDTVYRDYRGESISLFGPTQTIGSRIDKNNKRISNDEARAMSNRRLGKPDEE